jgi:hypothetical protein
MMPVLDQEGVAHGTEFGGPDLAYPSPVIGDRQLCAFLDGTDDYVTFGDNHDLSGTSPWTVEFWARMTTLPGAGVFPRVLDKRFTDGGGLQAWSILVLPDLGGGEQGLLQFQRNVAGVAVNCSTTSKISTTIWQHFAWTYDGTNMRAHTNGVLQTTSAAATTSVVAGTVELYLGRAVAGGDFWGGAIAELAIYTAALDVKVLDRHWRAGLRRLRSYGGRRRFRAP